MGGGREVRGALEYPQCLLGADTEDVYSSLLGLSKDEIAALREEKAI